MPSQAEFPPKWSCESEEKRVRVEVRVPTESGEPEDVSGRLDLDTNEDEQTLTVTSPVRLGRLVIKVYDTEQDRHDGKSPRATLNLSDADNIEEVFGEYEYTFEGATTDTLLGFNFTSGVAFADVAVPQPGGESGFNWVEIPTESVEQWVTKGDAARIQRTAKVRFPTEWGENNEAVRHNSPRKLIEQYDSESASSFMMARVSWQDKNGNWILNHFGWIGGVGGTSQPNLSKMWVYDLAELLSGVPIGATYNNPTIKQALEDIGRKTNDNTPIPLSGATIMPPETEEEYKVLAQNYDPLGGTEEGGADNLRAPGGGGSAYYSLSEGDYIPRAEGSVTSKRGDVVAVPQQSGENFEALVINTGFDFFDLGKKSFVSNHDTLLDLYSWFESKTGAKLHFEPRPRSVVLVADVVPERRVFSQREVIEKKIEKDEMSYSFHEPINVRINDALYEMKPINTLHLRGSTASGLLDPAKEFIDDAAEAFVFGAAGKVFGEMYEPPSKQYPVIKVQVPSLVEAADGKELSPKVVESEASTEAEAEREAIKELREILEETTEGKITMDGAPRMMPYDAIDSFEECLGDVEYEQTPVRYEVETVKHEKTAGDTYKTTANVSVWANDENIKTVKSTTVDVDSGS